MRTSVSLYVLHTRFVYSGLVPLKKDLLFVVFFLYKRSQKQSVARLSYAYGPDLELSNVRAQRYHQTNAANPQYMW